MIMWPCVALGSKVKMLSGGTPSKKVPEYWKGDIPWVSSGEMTQRYISDTQLHVSADGVKKGTKLIAGGTVLIVVRGMSLAKEFRVSITKREMTFNQDVKALQCSDDLLPKYLFFYLLSQANSIRDSATEASHGTKKLESAVLENWPLFLPNITTQEKVVDMISKYDDLIENNKRRMALLEEAAHHIYKEWFINFRFPGHDYVRFNKGVPEGWFYTNFGEVANILKGKNITKTKAIPGTVPVVAGGLTPAYYHNKANTNGPVVTVSASGANAGYVNLYHENIWASDCSYMDNNTKQPIYFFYLLLKNRQAEITSMQKGAAQPHVYPKDLKRLEVCLPDADLIRKFSDIVTSNFDCIKNLQSQNHLLERARDILLPKLMTGEISV